MPDYFLRDLILNDSRYLRDWLGEAVPDFARSARHKITLSAIRAYLRELIHSPLFKAYVWEKEEGSEAAEVLALIFSSQTPLRAGFWQMEFLLNPSITADFTEAERLLDGLLRRSGQMHEVKAVNLHIPESYEALTAAAEKLPAKLSFERYPQGRSSRQKEEQWLRLYTLSKTSNWPYTWVFVPTPVGLWAVYGNEHYVSYLDWLDYEAPIEDIQLRELCIADGYADACGVLKTREDCEAIPSPPQGRHVPEPLRQAARQLEAYASGKLKHFDLPLVFDEGTRFQRRVWQEIAAIPYGATRSYEEIGIKLADGDTLKGRNMTRAVGAACAANPLAIFVPCHRVIAKDNKLQGYAFGVERKNWLLSRELLGWPETEPQRSRDS